jgi:hypothetical protein
MRICHYILFLFLSVSICYGQNYPNVIDSTEKTTHYLEVDTSLNAWYEILDIDSLSSTIGANTSDYVYWLQEFYNLETARYCLINDLTAQTIGLELFVDTTQILGITRKPIWDRGLFNRQEGETEIMWGDVSAENTVVAYPVFLINRSDSISINIKAQDGSLLMICEAQNENGEWVPIEYWSDSWCGNSYATYKLPPNHIMYTKFTPYKGELKTKARLALQSGFGTTYSNEFFISVNPGQFVKKKE